MKTCLECLNLDLRQYPKHATVGFGHCVNTPTGCFNSFRHPICEKFKQAPEEIVQKRIEFDKKCDDELTADITRLKAQGK